MKCSPESTTVTIQSQCQSKTKKTRKPNTYVSDRSRLIMLILIIKFDISCYLAARVLNIPYENAKQIYRGFRRENRIIWNLYNPLGSAENYNTLMLSQMEQLQQEAKRILIESLKTHMFTLPQKIKVFQSNFDEFILEATLKDLRYIGYSLDSNFSKNRVLQSVDQRASEFAPLTITNSSFDATCEIKEANKEEEEIMR